MSQHDGTIANDTGANVRADIQSAVQAALSTSMGATEPATMYAGQPWADTTSGRLKIRNAANTAWITTAISITTDYAIGGTAGSRPVLGSGGIQFSDGSIQAYAYAKNRNRDDYTDVWSTTSTTWTQVGSGSYQIIIAPTSASNYVLVGVKLMFSFDDGGASPNQMYAPLLRVMRGATPISVGVGADFADVSFETAAHYNGGAYGLPEYHLFCVNATFIDVPATTNATTYSVQVKLPSSSMTFQTNKTITEFADISGHTYGCSNLFVMEI